MVKNTLQRTALATAFINNRNDFTFSFVMNCESVNNAVLSVSQNLLLPISNCRTGK